jgi:hypothetical protein
MLAVGRPRRCGVDGSCATSGPALLFIQAEIGAVVRGVKAGEFDYPT